MTKKPSVPERIRRQVRHRPNFCRPNITRSVALLFNPREQRWNRHFRLNGGRIEGITSSGRATVALLHLNDAERVAYRLGLIDLGHYPAQ